MAEPSGKEIDSMVETCVNAVKQGKTISFMQWRGFHALIKKAAEARTQKRLLYSHYSSLPESILVDALDLGLVANQQQKIFVAGMRRIMRWEAALSSLSHLFPAKFGKFEQEIHGKPLQQKIAAFERLSGTSLSGLFSHVREWFEIYEKVNKLEGAQKKKVWRQKRELEISIIKEIGAASGNLRMGAAARMARPDERQEGGKRLLRYMREQNSSLSRREMNTLLRAVQALDKMKIGKKPPQRKRL